MTVHDAWEHVPSMPITTSTRRATNDEIAREMDRRGEVIERLEARIEALEAEVERLRTLLRSAVSSADRNCPCHEETPNPCPKCGASVENLEACRAGELTLPVGVYYEIRVALEASHADR